MDAVLAAIVSGNMARWPEDLRGPTDVEATARRIRFHGIALLLAERGAWAGWPETLRASVEDEARMQVLWEAMHRRILHGLFAAFEQAGVAAMALKGTALAYSLYADPAQRRRGDSDLLVRSRDLRAARKALEQQGFVRRPPPHGVLFQEAWESASVGGMQHVVDLHWQPVDSLRLQTVLSVDAMVAAALPLPALHARAMAPDPGHALVHAALNQALHARGGYWSEGENVAGGARLIWAKDYDLLARALDEKGWAALAGFARARGVAPLVMQALEFAERVFRTPVPRSAMDLLASAKSETAITRYLTEGDRKVRLASDLAAARGVRQQGRFLARIATPSPGHLRARFVSHASWPTPLLRARWLLGAAREWLTGRRT